MIKSTDFVCTSQPFIIWASIHDSSIYVWFGRLCMIWSCRFDSTVYVWFGCLSLIFPNYKSKDSFGVHDIDRKVFFWLFQAEFKDFLDHAFPNIYMQCKKIVIIFYCDRRRSWQKLRYILTTQLRYDSVHTVFKHYSCKYPAKPHFVVGYIQRSLTSLLWIIYQWLDKLELFTENKFQTTILYEFKIVAFKIVSKSY